MAPGRSLLLAVVCSSSLFLMARSAYGTTQDSTVIPRVPNPPQNLANLPGDLRAIAVPQPVKCPDGGPPGEVTGDLGTFVKDRAAAIRLGKALFWDMQVGSDGIQACASCHFHAGADLRTKNQLSPGLKMFPEPEHEFSRGTGPNYQLTTQDFPFRRLRDPADRTSKPVHDNNDVASSQGVHFLAPDPQNPSQFLPDPDGFRIGDANVRRVEPRNTPTAINAVFNHRNFWDGRASNLFNGVNHVGRRDPGARVVSADDFGTPRLTPVCLENASLASQSVAPIVSFFEQARPGRTNLDVGQELARGPRELGRRISSVRPLARQKVHPKDSVLGRLSRFPEPGLSVGSYDSLVKDAFHPRWWHSSKLVRVASDGTVTFVDTVEPGDTAQVYTQIQYNFALFFGLSVQLYEATLVSDDTPWDRFRRQFPSPVTHANELNPYYWLDQGQSPPHISLTALFGAHLFNDRARGPNNLRCSNCHEEAELTDASVRRVNRDGRIRVRDGSLIDRGFNNIAVRPTTDDLSVGADDGFGPLSFTRQAFPGAPPAEFEGVPVTRGFAVDGAFKIPALRNVELTAPYFHNGGALTLEQVMEFYSRGGDLAPIVTRNGKKDPTIEPLSVPNLTQDEIAALVAFMKVLTDERVRFRKAPFDHPQIFVPNGHPGDHTSVTNDGRGLATDTLVEICEVGAEGGRPLTNFLEGEFKGCP